MLQATEAETKEDREIICEEVFCDITGQLDFIAKGKIFNIKGCMRSGKEGGMRTSLLWQP